MMGYCRDCGHEAAGHKTMRNGKRPCCLMGYNDRETFTYLCHCDDLPPNDNFEFIAWYLKKKLGVTDGRS